MCIPINQGMGEEEVNCFEKKHKITLPSSFKQYIHIVNGMFNGQTDDHLISFLSLEMIEQESNIETLPGNEVELIFAEYSIYCHWYVLRFSRSGINDVVVGTNGVLEKHIADSFEDFMIKYLTNPERIAYFW